MQEPPSGPLGDFPADSGQPDYLLAAAVLLLIIVSLIGFGIMPFAPIKGSIFLGTTTPIFVVAALVAINRTDHPKRLVLSGCMLSVGGMLVAIAGIVWFVATWLNQLQPGLLQ